MASGSPLGPMGSGPRGLNFPEQERPHRIAAANQRAVCSRYYCGFAGVWRAATNRAIVSL